MFELVIFGGLGFAITWFKSVRVAVWSGLVLAFVVVFLFTAFLASFAGADWMRGMAELTSLFLVSLLKGEAATWTLMLIVGFAVSCYAGGIYLAVWRKRKQGQTV